MSKDTFWFKHDHNARTDKEIMKVRMKMGMSGVGLFWCIVEMLYEEKGYMLRTEYERIAFELQSNIEDVTRLVEEFNLFKKDGEKFWSNSVLDRLEYKNYKSQKARESVSYRKDRTNVERSNNEQVTIRREEKRREENNTAPEAFDFSKEITPHKRVELMAAEKKNEDEPENRKHLENMIVLEMMKIWMEHRPSYQKQDGKDYTACLDIAYKIALKGKWRKSEVLNGRMPDTLKCWEKIVVFAKSHKFYKGLQLSSLENQWQSLCMSMDNETASETKKQPKIVL